VYAAPARAVRHFLPLVVRSCVQAVYAQARRQRARAPAGLWRQVHSGDSRCDCGHADPLTRDKLTCCVACVQASTIHIWLRYGTSGAGRSLPFNLSSTIDKVAEVAVKELVDLSASSVKPNAIAAYKATYDKETRTATVEGRDLDPCSTLAELGIAEGNHVVFKLRAPAAATGGAGTSSGERRAAPWALAPASVRIALQQLYPCLPAHVAGTSGAASAAGGAAASSGERRAAPAMAQRLGFFAARASLLLLFCDASAGSAAAATGGAGTSSGEQRAVPCALTPSSVRTSLQQFACL